MNDDQKVPSEADLERERKEAESRKTLRDFLRAFLVPTLINKILMLYFGLKYSEFPGEGYGWGLIATIVFFLFSLVTLLWKYKDVEDP